jgi:acyl carrier protein
MDISRDDIRVLLTENKLFASVGEQADGDEHIAWDSLSLTWFLTAVEQRYGLDIDPADVSLEQLSTVNNIHAYLEAHVKARR